MVVNEGDKEKKPEKNQTSDDDSIEYPQLNNQQMRPVETTLTHC